MIPNAAPLLVRELRLDLGAAAIQHWRMLQINVRRHQIDGALVPDRQRVDRDVLGRRHPGLLDRHDRPAPGCAIPHRDGALPNRQQDIAGGATDILPTARGDCRAPIGSVICAIPQDGHGGIRWNEPG